MKKFALILAVFLCGCSSSETVYAPVSAQKNERYLDNVRVHQEDEHGVVYEYKNVRIDEIAYLASRYCHEHGSRKAVLHDSLLYKNFSRRAAFDCL